MRTLITSCGHIRDMPRRMLLELWARALEVASPGIDILHIDSASPVDAAAILAPFGFKDGGVIDDDSPVDMRSGGKLSVRFDTAAWGHRSNEGGRAVRKGLLTAIENDYEAVVYLESDCLFAPSIAPIVDNLARLGVPVAMPWCMEYNYPETQIAFYDVAYLKRTDFVNRYDWHHADNGIIDELRREAAHGKDLMILPLRGRHNNTGWLDQENFFRVSRYGLDWLSHCSDFTLYYNFLQANGVSL